MGTAKLNLDVLGIVCKFLTRISDVLSFSLTCSALHPIAIQQLLSIHTIPLTSSASIHRFHRFLFADEHARAPHVRSLKIGSQALRPQIGNQPGDVSLLLDILKSCRHLEHFSLSSENASYQHRNDWNSHIANTAAAASGGLLLQAVCVPLPMLSIDILNPKGNKWDPAALEGFLPRFAPTLEKLKLHNLFLVPWEPEVSGSSRPASMTQYPAIRSLSIHSLEGVPTVSLLQHLFPALDTLRIYALGGTDVPGDHQNFRTTNQRTQGRRPDSAWKKLDRLVCGPTTFYALCLLCPIGLVMIDRCTKHSKDDLVVALREKPVPRLKLSLRLNPGYDIFDGLFSAELGRTLSHLTLCLLDTKGGAEIEMPNGGKITIMELGWGDILDKMTPSLEPLQNLTHLRVVAHCSLCDDPSRTVAPYKLRDALRHSKVLEGTAASVVRLLPSLQYVFITTSVWFGRFDRKRRWHAARAWRVIPASDDASSQAQNGQSVLVNLTGDAAERIIRKEELVLSEADEFGLPVWSVCEVSLNSPLRNAGHAQATHIQGLAYSSLPSES